MRHLRALYDLFQLRYISFTESPKAGFYYFLTFHKIAASQLKKVVESSETSHFTENCSIYRSVQSKQIQTTAFQGLKKLVFGFPETLSLKVLWSILFLYIPVGNNFLYWNHYLDSSSVKVRGKKLKINPSNNFGSHCIRILFDMLLYKNRVEY